MGRRTLHRLELEAGDGAGAQLAAEADAPVLGLDDPAGDYKLSLSPTTAVRRGDSGPSVPEWQPRPRLEPIPGRSASTRPQPERGMAAGANAQRTNDVGRYANDPAGSGHRHEELLGNDGSWFDDLVRAAHCFHGRRDAGGRRRERGEGERVLTSLEDP